MSLSVVTSCHLDTIAFKRRACTAANKQCVLIQIDITGLLNKTPLALSLRAMVDMPHEGLKENWDEIYFH